MEGSVLVVGGGITGIQASLDLTELGFKVYLIEREPSIGGHMAQLDKTFPKNDCSLCILAPKMVAVYRNPNIEILTLSEVKKISGSPGNFKVTAVKNPRYVDEIKCRGCGDCAAKCPKIEAPNIFDMNLGKRKSIYIPFPQAIPPVYLIDPKLCLFLNREICGVCAKVCQAEAIDFDQKPQEIMLNVGAIVVATGFDMLGEELAPMWGYQYKNIVNSLEYERIICPTGPFGGNILRPSDEQEPEKVVFIQCAGSGYLKGNIPYCSRVCCMYTAKEAMLTKIYTENIQVSVFRHNIRVFGKNFYEYTKKAQEEYDIKYYHTKIKNIEEDSETNDLIIHYIDLKDEKFVEKDLQANLVILAAPLVPSKGTKKLAKILDIELDKYGFFKSRSFFNKSQSLKEGIFLSGFSQGPMNISETVSDASAVASQVASYLNSARYSQIIEKEVDILPEKKIIYMTPRALIIGGGVSGMTAALNIGNQGFETIIVEKEKQLGGNLNYINMLYPSQQKASPFLNQIENDIKKNKNIQVFLDYKIKNIKGSLGNYNITIVNSMEKIYELTVGTIIVATGGQEFKPYGLFQYDEKNKNIMTQMELEQLLKNIDNSWLENIKHITTIMCVNARQKGGFSYCSNICCGTTIKNINILKKIKPELEMVVLFRDLHVAKKEFEEFFSKRKKIAKYLRYNLENIPEVVKINENPERYEIKLYNDINPNEYIKFKTDLIVLSTPMIPSENLQELSDMLNVPLDENGFFIEAHVKLRPLDFAVHGVFICGCAQWPKNVQDSIAEANGAAGRASRFLSLREISTTKLEFYSFLLSIECFFKDMEVNTEKCNGCGICVEVCSYKAISLIDSKQEFEEISISIKKAFINPAICKGCGRCASACKLKAIDPRHYDFKQISAIIDPYFLEGVRTKDDNGAIVLEPN
jgi:heterodisulfide reductase subunit A-like polyferredoxin